MSSYSNSLDEIVARIVQSICYRYVLKEWLSNSNCAVLQLSWMSSKIKSAENFAQQICLKINDLSNNAKCLTVN